jgi:phage baseplate assembly protein V
MRDTLNRSDSHKQEMLIRNLVARGVVTKSDASQKMQTLDLRLENGQRPTKVEHWERFGFTYRPKAGAEVLAFAVNGNRDHLVVTDAADRRYRVTNMEEGELAVHDDQGQVVHFKRGGIHVKSGLGVTIECAAGITLKGPITIEGDITQQGGITSTGVHAASGHV